MRCEITKRYGGWHKITGGYKTMVDGGEPMGAENNLTQKLFKTSDSKGRKLKQK